MVNLINPRQPLALHSQHAKEPSGREQEEDSSMATMSERQPQHSRLLTCVCLRGVPVFPPGLFPGDGQEGLEEHGKRHVSVQSKNGH